MPSLSSQMTQEMSLAITATPTSILAGIHRTEIPVKETTHNNYATSMNWLATSSMKLGKPSQHVILPISEIHSEVSDTSELISDINTIKEKQPYETSNISTSTSFTNAYRSSFAPLSAMTEISSSVAVQHERPVIDHSTTGKDLSINQLLYVDERTSEKLLKTIPSRPKEVYQTENSRTSSYADNFHGYKGNEGNYNIAPMVSVIRSMFQSEQSYFNTFFTKRKKRCSP